MTRSNPYEPDTLAKRMDEYDRRWRVRRVGMFDPDTPPASPTGVTMNIRVREIKNHLEYSGVVSCNPLTVDTCEADIQTYIFQIRPTDENGVPLDGTNVRTRDLPARQFFDSDADNPHVVYDVLENPKTRWWQARARILDKAQRYSAWSAWTTPQLPFVSAEPKPPTPQGVILTFLTDERERYDRILANVQCNFISGWDVPGGDHEDDMAYYSFVIQVSRDGITPLRSRDPHIVDHNDFDGAGDPFTIFHHIRKKLFYRAKARSIDRYNRKSDWSGWTNWSKPNDDDAPPVPENVVAIGAFKRVELEWEHPLDDQDDDIVDDNVAYYIAQVDGSGPLFPSPLKTYRFLTRSNITYETEKYNQRYWLRVRAVDSSGNKSPWVTAGPVRPQRIRGARVEDAGSILTPQVSYQNSSGLELLGSPTNQASLVSTTDPALVWANGEASDGTLTSDITTSSVVDRVYVGVAFRVQDSQNFMFAALVDISGTNAVIIGRRLAGTITTLATSSGFTVVGEQTYAMRVTLVGSAISVFVDNVLAVTVNNASFQTVTSYGLLSRRGATLDNGESRWVNFEFTPSTESEPTLSDDFERSAGVIGIAASGQTWQVVGTWNVEETTVAASVYGNAVTMPIFYGEDQTVRTGISIVAAGGGTPRRLGLGGTNTNPITLVLDRPTQIIAWAFANYSNENASTSTTMQFFIIFQVNGTNYAGRQTNGLSSADDEGQARQRLAATQHSKWVDASPEAPATVQFWWGYRITNATELNHTIRNQKMTILLSYAPDFTPSFTAASVPQWTRSGLTRAQYRAMAGDD